jgi:hypothetical protein
MDKKLTAITEQLEMATAHLAEIRAQIAEFTMVETLDQFKAAIKGANGAGKALYLENEPIRMDFEARNGSGKQYLYFYYGKQRKRFRWDDDEPKGYKGPIGKQGTGVRKLYVGCDQAAQARAYQMLENRKQRQELTHVEDRLDAWITRLERDRDELVKRSQNWPRADLASLGPAATEDLVAVSPNAENGIAWGRCRPSGQMEIAPNS